MTKTPDLRLHGYAPGNYSCRCYLCHDTFTGDKLATTCERCATHIATRMEFEPARPFSDTFSAETAVIKKFFPELDAAKRKRSPQRRQRSVARSRIVRELFEILDSANVHQIDFAPAMNISSQGVSQWRTGKAQMRAWHAEKMAEALGYRLVLVKQEEDHDS